MAEKRVKVGKEFEHIPAVKSGHGWLGLEKGKFGKVRFESRSRKLELWIKQGGEWKRSLLPVEEYAKANEVARKANKVGEQTGASFGTLRKEEEAALKLWREYVEQETRAGTPPRNLAEIMRELIERKRTKDETPFFDAVALQFMEMKEKDGGARFDYRERLGNYVKKLSAALKGIRLADISEEKFLSVLERIVKARDGISPAAPKTLNHWIDAGKEIFKWFYTRENKRRAREGFPPLDNPLELLAKKKIRKNSEPETLPVSDARALLCDLLEHSPRAVPAVALQLFCGVRNACALRLRWRDVREKEVFLSLAITKTSETRNAPIPENLRAWLNAAIVAIGSKPAPESLVFAGQDTPQSELDKLTAEARERVETVEYRARKSALVKILARSQKRTGISKPANAFRHTAVSALCKIHGFDKAADYCGHDIRTQGKYYRAAVSEQDAKDYFGIMPPAGDGKAIAFDRSRAKNTAKSASKTQDGQEAAPEESPADFGATA